MVSEKLLTKMSSGSWIRAMFEEGERRRKHFGADKVFDFSLGNPDIEPPKGVIRTLRNLVNSDEPNLHKYMNNAGYPDVRKKIADSIHKDTGIPITEKHIIMTCGAAGALNVVFKTILNPGDEVIIFSPFFPEYFSYIDNHGGRTVVSPCYENSFDINLQELEKNITPATKAVLINSPNNPTGVIFKESTLLQMAEILERKEKEYSTKILVISDEPYAQLVYDNNIVPSILKIFPNSVIVNSFSKSLALPGERIGYIAVNKTVSNADSLINGLIYCNRILGFVNAPSLFQKVIGETLDEKVDINVYKQRRDFLYENLIRMGFSCVKPQGAFYLFPKSLIKDDVAFVNLALKYNLLLVPGSGFGCPGYFRISYAVDQKTIINSIPAFEALAEECLTKR
ncbi:MAG: pyridoxal phosphate-dependent aminotransferase [Caldicoprobacterales bacterium]|jgi:aspartate aminotransferase|nr:pyridoxal phosphate-dependent aminotransferase [Clostridiales bacterium]